jgi:hypothetical protein
MACKGVSRGAAQGRFPNTKKEGKNGKRKLALFGEQINAKAGCNE